MIHLKLGADISEDSFQYWYLATVFQYSLSSASLHPSVVQYAAIIMISGNNRSLLTLITIILNRMMITFIYLGIACYRWRIDVNEYNCYFILCTIYHVCHILFIRVYKRRKYWLSLSDRYSVEHVHMSYLKCM